MAVIPKVMGKLDKMRKPQDFVIYPAKSNGLIKIQSDKCIGLVDPENKSGRLYQSKSGGAYGCHLPLAAPFIFPSEFLEEVVKKWNDNYKGSDGIIRIL